MATKHEEFAADLYRLWWAGREDLPMLGEVFAIANHAVADTNIGMDAAFRRPAHFGGGSYGPVHGAWTALRDETQRILADTAVNLELTGEALCMAVREYAKTDREAESALNGLKERNGDPAPVSVRDPRYP